jgi:aspartate kinase
LIVTTNKHGKAEPLIDETRERASHRLRPLLNAGQVPVVTGFIGATAEGILTTLGRGGSDYSATILGAALGACEIIIWTDVDGVLSADPRLVPEARLLREISYAEAAELAFFGAKVLHPKTLRPVAEAGIPVWIRNSFAPEKPGTKITRTGRPAESGVKAITSISNVSLITLGGAGIVGVVGVAARTFAAVAAVRANVLLISQASSGNDICFIVESVDADAVVKALRQAFAADLAHHQVEHVTVDPDIAIVAVVGENMRGTPGIAGRVFSAMGHDRVNVIAVAQGSSEYNVSFVVSAPAMQTAVQAIHREFNLQRSSARLNAEEKELAAT